MTPGIDDLLAAYAIEDRSVPRVRMNFVASADGAATMEGRSGGLGGPTDRTAMEVLRALSDVVLVGAGTVRAEGYGGVRVGDRLATWRQENGLPRQPRLATVSRDLALAPEHPFFAEAVTTPLVITCADVPSERRDRLDAVADVIACGDALVDLSSALDELAGRGLRQVLCEGGPHLFGSLLEARLVDEVCLTMSPVLAGGDAGRIVRGATEHAHPLRLGHALADDEGFLLLRYAVAE
jgi:riboflavin biosynthesis pyrimidine reductase